MTTTAEVVGPRYLRARWLMVPAVIAAASVLVLLKTAIADWDRNPLASSQQVGIELIYQLAALGVTAIVLAVAYLLARRFPDVHAARGRACTCRPRAVGRDHARSRRDLAPGWRNFAIVITGVTALAVLLPVVQGGAFDLGRLTGLLPIILLLALSDAIVEEAIFRFGLVATLAGRVEPWRIAILSGAIFGGIHFFGVPGGPLGVALAGFLGWLLAKSMLETRGVGWALTIHFLQDVVIFSAILLVAA